MDDERVRRLAENEAIARQVNEQVEKLGQRWNAPESRSRSSASARSPSARSACMSRSPTTPPSASTTRASSSSTVTSIEEIERRVGEVGDAIVVEKLGPGRDVAVETA